MKISKMHHTRDASIFPTLPSASSADAADLYTRVMERDLAFGHHRARTNAGTS